MNNDKNNKPKLSPQPCHQQTTNNKTKPMVKMGSPPSSSPTSSLSAFSFISKLPIPINNKINYNNNFNFKLNNRNYKSKNVFTKYGYCDNKIGINSITSTTSPTTTSTAAAATGCGGGRTYRKEELNTINHKICDKAATTTASSSSTCCCCCRGDGDFSVANNDTDNSHHIFDRIRQFIVKEVKTRHLDDEEAKLLIEYFDSQTFVSFDDFPELVQIEHNEQFFDAADIKINYPIENYEEFVCDTNQLNDFDGTDSVSETAILTTVPNYSTSDSIVIYNPVFGPSPVNCILDPIIELKCSNSEKLILLVDNILNDNYYINNVRNYSDSNGCKFEYEKLKSLNPNYIPQPYYQPKPEPVIEITPTIETVVHNTIIEDRYDDVDSCDIITSCERICSLDDKPVADIIELTKRFEITKRIAVVFGTICVSFVAIFMALHPINY